MRASKMGRERELEQQSDCKEGSPEESINYEQSINHLAPHPKSYANLLGNRGTSLA